MRRKVSVCVFVAIALLCGFIPAAVSTGGPSQSAWTRARLADTSDHIKVDREVVGMHQNKAPPPWSDFLPEDRHRRFRSLEPDPEWLDLENDIRRRYLQHDPAVRWLMAIAAPGKTSNSAWARQKLRAILADEFIEDMQTGNVFRPLVPRELLIQGDLHLFNQSDGTPWMVPTNSLVRGMLLTGPQGGGKTRFLVWICRQLADRGIPFFALDPKEELKGWADYLNARYVSVEDISIDLSPPPGLTYEQWLRSLMPQLGEILGLVYSVELLQELATICIGQREKYILRTGRDTELSLNDLYAAVPFLTDVSRGRRAGYRDAVSTGLNRILAGTGNLFRCRKGIDLPAVFNQNTILGCRSITDEFAAKFLAFYLLFWLYEAKRFAPPTNHLERAIIMDDATLYLQKRTGFDAAGSTSSIAHVLARLRSSGNSLIATTQVPHLADPGILSLSHLAICLGGLHYGEDTKLLAQMMNLTEEQRRAIPYLARREAIGICAGSPAWPRVVHGYTVDVPDPDPRSQDL